MVAKKEKWRRKAVWSRVQEFATLTQMSINSYIISFVIGSEEMAASASRFYIFLLCLFRESLETCLPRD